MPAAGENIHLPSLPVTHGGTVIAACQLRKKAAGDWGHDTDIPLRHFQIKQEFFSIDAFIRTWLGCGGYVAMQNLVGLRGDGLAPLGSWLVCTNNVGYREMIAGALAAIISTVAVMVSAIQGNLRFGFRAARCRAGDLPSLVRIWTGTWELLQGDCETAFRRGGTPFTAAVPFDLGGNDPISAGRRAFAVTFTTITPNFIVLGFVKDQRLLLYHQILPGKVLKMTRHLGARP